MAKTNEQVAELATGLLHESGMDQRLLPDLVWSIHQRYDALRDWDQVEGWYRLMLNLKPRLRPQAESRNAKARTR